MPTPIRIPTPASPSPLKVGARHSRSDVQAIQDMHDYAVKLGAMCGDDAMPKSLKSFDDTLTYAGEALKMIGDNEVQGYLLRWGNPDEPDLSPQRDWFHAKTYLGRNDGVGVDVTFNHGIPLTNETRWASDLLPGYIKSTARDAYGLLATAVITADEQYQKFVRDMVGKGVLRWSSGALSHLVDRAPQKNGTNRIDRWIIGEGALTPTPAEPRLPAIVSLKSIIAALGNAQAGSTSATPTRVYPIRVNH